jgi:hypothetical protein
MGPKARCGPKESAQPIQRWLRPFTLEHGKLLSEGEDLESSIASIVKEDSEGGRE